MKPEKHPHAPTTVPDHGSRDIRRFPDLPLVSVVIPCYNQGRFLANAICSVLNQTYPQTEIIVINDGSTDETEQVALSFEGIRYFVQENMGLPAARNRGLKASRGHYIIFLDADDWLYPDAVELNLAYFRSHPEMAFVAGGFTEVHDYGPSITAFNAVSYARKAVPNNSLPNTTDMYRLLLQGNCIGNPATVLYARWVLDELRFDQSGEVYGCEDYDHYLHIARQHPVLWHRLPLSFYRKHNANMSANSAMMYRSATRALQRQRTLTRSAEENQSLQTGMNYWKKYYLFQYVGVHYRKIAGAIVTFGLKNDAALDWGFIWECRHVYGPVLWKKIVRKTYTKLGLPIPESYYLL